MLCPIDGADLVMTDRQGVEIDYCPKCRGVWLDRGELDKVIERSNAQGVGRRDDDDDDRFERRDDRVDVRPSGGGMIGKIGGSMARMGDRDDRRRDDDDDEVRYDRHGRPRKKKRESFLDDLFDF